MGEVGHAVARGGMSLGEANEMVVQLLLRYEHAFRLQHGNPGAKFDQAYDLTTLQPLPAWQEMYERVKVAVRVMGLVSL